MVRSDNTSSSYKECFNRVNPNSSYNTEIEYEENENFRRLKRVLEVNKNIYLDLDLDYFTDDSQVKKQNFTGERLMQYFELIKRNLDNIKIITVAEADSNCEDMKIEFLRCIEL